MRRPQAAEEYVTVVDNKGRERIQRVEYIVTDVHGETVYVTADGLRETARCDALQKCVAPRLWQEEAGMEAGLLPFSERSLTCT